MIRRNVGMGLWDSCIFCLWSLLPDVGYFLSGYQTAELCAAATKEVGEENAVQIANYLCKGNYAVSGSVEGCDVIERIAKPDFKARMTVRLAVAGAFHTKYMQPAVEQLLEALSNTEIVTPRIPVISNVDAAPHSSPEAIKEILSRQVGTYKFM